MLLLVQSMVKVKISFKRNRKYSAKKYLWIIKKINEEISFIYNQFYNLKLTGLRFFTVYGEWGRPDMMMLKFIDSYFKKNIQTT